jgi:hypothetical protein
MRMRRLDSNAIACELARNRRSDATTSRSHPLHRHRQLDATQRHVTPPRDNQRVSQRREPCRGDACCACERTRPDDVVTTVATCKFNQCNWTAIRSDPPMQPQANRQTIDANGRWPFVRTCAQRSVTACLCSSRRISCHRISSPPIHSILAAAVDDLIRSATPAHQPPPSFIRTTSRHTPTHSNTSARFELHVTRTRQSTRRHDRSLARASAVVGWTRRARTGGHAAHDTTTRLRTTHLACVIVYCLAALRSPSPSHASAS